MERITTNPQQCGGQPCIRGMRIRVADILEPMPLASAAIRSWRTIRIWRPRTWRLPCATRPIAACDLAAQRSGEPWVEIRPR